MRTLILLLVKNSTKAKELQGNCGKSHLITWPQMENSA